jgi:two-component system phosphate regulon sensor histidine kinase PhoR
MPINNDSTNTQIDALCKKIGQVSSARITIINPDGKVLGDSGRTRREWKTTPTARNYRCHRKGLGKSSRFSTTDNKNMMYVAVPIEYNPKRTALSNSNIHRK